MGEPNVFDHVAVATPRWSDGYPALVGQLGGSWMRGGVTETFSPAQFGFAGGMVVELLQPGPSGKDFVGRFLAQRGPAAHHLTFDVDDLDRFAAGCAELGLDLMPGHIDVPGRREAFVHPRASGMGTLLQAVESESDIPTTQPPADVPVPDRPPARLEWVALVVPDPARALALFGRVLGGVPVDAGTAGGGAWTLLEWTPARRLLLVDRRSGPALGCGDGSPGVDHVLFTDPDVPRRPVGSVGAVEAVPGAGPLGLPFLDARRPPAVAATVAKPA